MDGDVVQYLTLAVTLAGFITIWVRVGVHKGQSDNRIKVLEEKVSEHAQKLASMQSVAHAFEVKVSEVMTELKTKIGFILSGIEELKKKQEVDDAAKK